MKTWITTAACAVLTSLAISGAGAQEATPFRIGILTDYSSVFAANGGKGAQLALEMAVADFGGKVLGRPIEVLAADHQNKVDVATGIAREWMESKNVNAIFDLMSSAVALSVIPLVEKSNRIAIVSGAASSEITGKGCTPVSFHWTYDSYSLSRMQPKALVGMGKKNWYLINFDNMTGAALERDMNAALEKFGGKVTGKVRVPLGAANYTSTMLTAQNSKADVIMLGGAGTDLLNQAKQAREFGISDDQVLATPYATIIDVHTLGLTAAQGLYTSDAFYWDLNDETRAWSKRFIEKMKVPATSYQVGNYSAALHYLKAVAAAGTADGRKVADEMRRTRVNDMMTKNAEIRPDGRVIRELHLFRVKKPSESKYKLDYLERVATISGADAFRPLSESECPLVKR